MNHFQKSVIIILGALVLGNFIPAAALAEDAPDISGIIIKVDSDGLRAEIKSTGKSPAPEGMTAGTPEARLSAADAAAKEAYSNLVHAVKSMAADYFPKERYLVGETAIKGAILSEVRYPGDGGAEADIILYVSLNGPLANKFEKEMRLAGYRVVEYDRPSTEITNETLKP